LIRKLPALEFFDFLCHEAETQAQPVPTRHIALSTKDVEGT
jgi:hypothetical protein